MKPKIYLDTSVFSAYYDERLPERMRQTHSFWRVLPDYELYCSELTIAELAETKDLELRGKFLKLTEDFQKLLYSDEIRLLAEEYIKTEAIPRAYIEDALHISLAVVNDLDILISWNFEHIVKRKTKILVNSVNLLKDYRSIEILSPPEL